MNEFDFALVATCDIQIDTDTIAQIADALFEAGCDDCTVMSRNQTLIIEFDREAESYERAVVTAIRDVHSVDGMKVLSVDAGDYVGLSDAAELSELSRSTLSKFSKGDRGDGTFPSPYLRVTGKAPLYDWSEISKWLADKGHAESELAENASVTSKINLALKLKNGDFEEIQILMSELA